MMAKKDDGGGPAFPQPYGSKSMNARIEDGNVVSLEAGMTLREYAAIKLGVPDSGIDWLDEMIRESNRPGDIFAKPDRDVIAPDFDSVNEGMSKPNGEPIEPTPPPIDIIAEHDSEPRDEKK